MELSIYLLHPLHAVTSMTAMPSFLLGFSSLHSQCFYSLSHLPSFGPLHLYPIDGFSEGITSPYFWDFLDLGKQLKTDSSAKVLCTLR